MFSNLFLLYLGIIANALERLEILFTNFGAGVAFLAALGLTLSLVRIGVEFDESGGDFIARLLRHLSPGHKFDDLLPFFFALEAPPLTFRMSC